MPVDVEIRRTTVSTPSLEVGEFAERGKIGGRVERDAVRKRESFSGGDARRERIQFLVM
jgi:hypothetical protein